MDRVPINYQYLKLNWVRGTRYPVPGTGTRYRGKDAPAIKEMRLKGSGAETRTAVLLT